MNQHDVHLLQRISGYPALTITLPTHLTWQQARPHSGQESGQPGRGPSVGRVQSHPRPYIGAAQPSAEAEGYETKPQGGW